MECDYWILFIIFFDSIATKRLPWIGVFWGYCYYFKKGYFTEWFLVYSLFFSEGRPSRGDISVLVAHNDDPTGKNRSVWDHAHSWN